MSLSRILGFLLGKNRPYCFSIILALLMAYFIFHQGYYHLRCAGRCWCHSHSTHFIYPLPCFSATNAIIRQIKYFSSYFHHESVVCLISWKYSLTHFSSDLITLPTRCRAWILHFSIFYSSTLWFLEVFTRTGGYCVRFIIVIFGEFGLWLLVNQTICGSFFSIITVILLLLSLYCFSPILDSLSAIFAWMLAEGSIYYQPYSTHENQPALNSQLRPHYSPPDLQQIYSSYLYSPTHRNQLILSTSETQPCNFEFCLHYLFFFSQIWNPYYFVNLKLMRCFHCFYGSVTLCGSCSRSFVIFFGVLQVRIVYFGLFSSLGQISNIQKISKNKMQNIYPYKKVYKTQKKHRKKKLIQSKLLYQKNNQS